MQRRRMVSLMLCAVLALCAGCAGEVQDSGLPSGDDVDSGIIEDIDEIEWEGEDPEEMEEEPEEPLEQIELTLEDAKKLLTPGDDGVVFITSRNQLAALAIVVNAGDTDYLDASYELGEDINLAGVDFVPIGGYDGEGEGYSFDGAFDGNGFLVRNLTIRDNGFAAGTGLFGAIGSNGTVRRTHVVSGNVRGSYNTGGFAGQSCGALYDCSFNGEVRADGQGVGGFLGMLYAEDGQTATAELCAGNAEVRGAYGAGVLIGQALENTQVEDGYALGKITAIPSAEGFPSELIGGLVGSNSGSITRCYSLVEVYTNVEANLVGGFIGYNTGEVQSCYFNNVVTSNWKEIGQTADEAKVELAGCTSEELTEQETYEGWDFDMVWDISAQSRRGLPFLR